VSRQTVKYLKHSDLFPVLQSVYRANHSMETAVLKVADILLGLDSGNLTMLMLLDLSAAFNSIDHNTVLRHLTTSYGLGGVVIDWFACPHT